MIRMCGWCQKYLGKKAPLSDPSITHTICKECEKKLMKELAPAGKNPPKKLIYYSLYISKAKELDAGKFKEVFEGPIQSDRQAIEFCKAIISDERARWGGVLRHIRNKQGHTTNVKTIAIIRHMNGRFNIR